MRFRIARCEAVGTTTKQHFCGPHRATASPRATRSIAWGFVALELRGPWWSRPEASDRTPTCRTQGDAQVAQRRTALHRPDSQGHFEREDLGVGRDCQRQRAQDRVEHTRTPRRDVRVDSPPLRRARGAWRRAPLVARRETITSIRCSACIIASTSFARFCDAMLPACAPEDRRCRWRAALHRQRQSHGRGAWSEGRRSAEFRDGRRDRRRDLARYRARTIRSHLVWRRVSRLQASSCLPQAPRYAMTDG